MAKLEPYPSDFTEREWRLLRPLIPSRGRLGRPPRYPLRKMVEAIVYVARSGCSWRMLPREFPHWRLVYYYFAKWQRQGVWEKINGALRDRARLRLGKKKPRPLRYSTARVLRWLGSAESAVTMLAKRCWDANAMCWWTPAGMC